MPGSVMASSRAAQLVNRSAQLVNRSARPVNPLRAASCVHAGAGSAGCGSDLVWHALRGPGDRFSGQAGRPHPMGVAKRGARRAWARKFFSERAVHRPARRVCRSQRPCTACGRVPASAGTDGAVRGDRLAWRALCTSTRSQRLAGVPPAAHWPAAGRPAEGIARPGGGRPGPDRCDRLALRAGQGGRLALGSCSPGFPSCAPQLPCGRRPRLTHGAPGPVRAPAGYPSRPMRPVPRMVIRWARVPAAECTCFAQFLISTLGE